MNKNVQIEYGKHKLEFDNWNLDILSQFLYELEQKKWTVQGKEVTVKTEKNIVDTIGNSCSSHTSESMDFFYKWGMYQKAVISYEDRTDTKRK